LELNGVAGSISLALKTMAAKFNVAWTPITILITPDYALTRSWFTQGGDDIVIEFLKARKLALYVQACGLLTLIDFIIGIVCGLTYATVGVV
jgi:hypothetical protein